MSDALIDIDPGLRANYLSLYGDVGSAWLNELPVTIDRCADRWSLTVGPALKPLTYAYVAQAERADGTAVILKLAFPGREQRTEITALEVFGASGAPGASGASSASSASGAVRLLASDADVAALLLERIVPGAMLRDVTDDAEATAIAADVMNRLWRPAPSAHGFPTVEHWSAGLERYRRSVDDGVGPLSVELVDLAETLFRGLLATVPHGGNVLLHGDLHHDNILFDDTRGWVAIDPKGVVGEPAYEAAALLRNPWNGDWAAEDPVGALDRRVHVLSQTLGLPRDRIVRWAVASAVLSACWSIEDHGDDGDWSIGCAQWLRELM